MLGMKNTKQLLQAGLPVHAFVVAVVLRVWVHLTTPSHRIRLDRSQLLHKWGIVSLTMQVHDHSHTPFSIIFDHFSLPHCLALHEQMKGLSGLLGLLRSVPNLVYTQS